MTLAYFHTSYIVTFVSECTEASHCPGGGSNYECTMDNECECPMPFVLDDNYHCVGMLPFEKQNFQTVVLELGMHSIFSCRP